MNNIIENNKLIIAFMGMKPLNINGRYSLSKNHCTALSDSEDECINEFASITKYDTDYNWIREVVQAIEVKGYVVNIKGISCNIYQLLKEEPKDYISSFVCGDLSKKIDIVYSACIGFIKWYNQQQK